MDHFPVNRWPNHENWGGKNACNIAVQQARALLLLLLLSGSLLNRLTASCEQAPRNAQPLAK